MISGSALAAIKIFALGGLVLPIVLFIVWRMKTKQPISTIILGIATFYVFAMILERIPQSFLLTNANPVGQYILNHSWAYMLVGALLAGVFEETGRFVAFKFIIRKRQDRLTAITYGIGHGGGEALILMGLGGLQYLSYATLINSGQFDAIVAQVAAQAPEQVATVEAIPATLAAMTVSASVLGLFERVSAILLHIGCSIIVFKSVHEEGKTWLYPVAILVHAGLDLIAVAYQVGLIPNLIIIEILIFIFGAATLYLAYKYVYLTMPVTYAVEAAGTVTPTFREVEATETSDAATSEAGEDVTSEVVEEASVAQTEADAGDAE